MSELRSSAERITQMGRFPTRAPDRQLACEKVAKALANRPSGSIRDKEPWDVFLERIGVI